MVSVLQINPRETQLQDRRTLTASICLHESLLRTGLFKLRCQPRQLGQYFIHNAQFRREVVFVNVQSEMTTQESYLYGVTTQC
jgi:hypothetical protein